MAFTWTIVALVVVLGLCWRFLGSYMVAVYEGRTNWLGFVERPIYRMLGVDSKSEQSWKRYAVSVIAFSAVALAITYAIFRIQGHLPFNPQGFGAVRPDTAWNTAVSFVTNTNWQSYSGETTMSHLSQMGALAVQNFLSASVGMAVAVALIRGFARKGSGTIGNFWVDFVRGTIYVLLPIAFVAAIVFITQGALQTLGGPAQVHDALNGVSQTLPRGPIASQEVIKQLGTNGGGFFNANGAGPFENPTGLTNFLSIVLILCIPVALTYTFGKMVFSIRQGVAILAVMTILFGGWLAMATTAEHQGSPAMAAAGVVHQPLGNTEGKETRFGTPSSSLYNVTSTQTSTGSVDSAADSYTPIGGFAMLTGMMLGEVSPGGVGTGLYSMLLFAVITVFLGGLMVGRTPEYLGKKIQAREVKLAALGVLVMPDHGVGVDRSRNGSWRRPGRAAQRRTTRVLRDPVRIHLADQQQRLRVRRTERQYPLLQHHRDHRPAAGPVRDHRARSGPGGKPRGEEASRHVAGDLPHRQADVRRPVDQCGVDRRRADVLPCPGARADRGALQPRDLLLMSRLGRPAWAGSLCAPFTSGWERMS